ncbi:adenine nucleotide alpha hydrolase family protein [Candidatus Pacearchaeota archaeon]|nr:adenine nucleotide alpha hydrolase family protein [Candidatus Pacearchaeota archaeon]
MENNFTKKFESKVLETIQKYKLCSKKDRIAVACSGGKDSTTVLYLLHKFGFNVFAIYINLRMSEYSENCLKELRRFCKMYEIKLHVLDTKQIYGSSMCFIRSRIQQKQKLSNCTICGIMKRWLLNKKARELHATKLATGHNLDDEAETVIVNYSKGNLLLGINSGPATGIVADKKFVQRIKPLYFCSGKQIYEYAKNAEFPFWHEKCPCAIGSYRIDVRKFLNQFDDSVKENIVNNFIKILPKLRREFFDKQKKVIYCSVCGEPSRNEICSVCNLVSGKFK